MRHFVKRPLFWLLLTSWILSTACIIEDAPPQDEISEAQETPTGSEDDELGTGDEGSSSAEDEGSGDDDDAAQTGDETPAEEGDTPDPGDGGDSTQPGATPTPIPTPPPEPTPVPSACGASEVASENSWPAYASPSDLDGRNYEMGEVPPNFRIKDQNGEYVELYQFYGRVIMLEFGTQWCQGCLDSAPTSQNLFDTYTDDCVMFISILYQDKNGSTMSTNELKDWTDRYGIQFPVLNDSAMDASSDADFSAIPQYYFFDRTLTLRGEINQYPGDAILAEEIDKLL